MKNNDIELSAMAWKSWEEQSKGHREGINPHAFTLGFTSCANKFGIKILDPLITEQFLLSKGWKKIGTRKRIYTYLPDQTNYIKILNEFGISEKNMMYIYEGGDDKDGLMYFGEVPTESQYEVLNQLLKLH